MKTYKGRAEGIVDAVSNPGATVAGMFTTESVVTRAADAVTFGVYSSATNAVNAVQTVATDIVSGNGSASGQLVGGVVFDAAVAVAAAAVGKGISAVSNAAKGAEGAAAGAGSATKAIGPAGDAGGTVMKQLPEAMQNNARTSNSGGTVFKDPINPKGNNVRVENAKPNGQPAQQVPYVKETRNGASIDKNGNRAPSDSPEAHIPKDEYLYNR